jgi:hypothetical protein
MGLVAATLLFIDMGLHVRDSVAADLDVKALACE